MDLSDIVEVVILSGIIFFVLGYKAKSYFLARKKRMPNKLLAPNYLKPEGYLIGGDPMTQTKKK